MNRRSFLKSIAIACGAAVVCPGELLKMAQPVLRLWPLQKILLGKLSGRLTRSAVIFDEFATRRDKLYFAFKGEYY